MSNELKHIDEVFKRELENYSMNTSVSSLAKFGKMLNRFNFMRFGFGTFNIYYVVLLVSIITTGTIILSNYNNSPFPENIIDNNNSYLEDDKNASSDYEITTKEKIEDQKESESNKIKKSENKNDVIIENNEDLNSESDNNAKTINTPDVIKTDTIQKIINIQDTVYLTKKIVVTDTIKKVVTDKNKNKRTR
ncbi:MAG: hypothetical protein ABIJ97_10350 [Bacteroidota bacterium]